MAVRDDIEVIKTLDGSCYCPCQDLTYRFEVSLPEYGEARIRDRGCRKRLLDVHYAHPDRFWSLERDLMRGYVSQYRDLIYEACLRDVDAFWRRRRKMRNWQQVRRLIKMDTLECVFDADHSRHFWTSGALSDSDSDSDSDCLT